MQKPPVFLPLSRSPQGNFDRSRARDRVNSGKLDVQPQRVPLDFCQVQVSEREWHPPQKPVAGDPVEPHPRRGAGHARDRGGDLEGAELDLVLRELGWRYNSYQNCIQILAKNSRKTT